MAVNKSLPGRSSRDSGKNTVPRLPATNRAEPLDRLIYLCGLLLFLTVLAPQVNLYGRGLRTELPAIGVVLLLLFIRDHGAVKRAALKLRWVFFFGLIYLVQAGVRFIEVPPKYQEALLRNNWISPLLALAMIMIVTIFAERGGRAVLVLRRLVAVGWSLSLACGVPVLISHPAVARLTMGRPDEGDFIRAWAPYGISSYTGYTALAICAAALLVTAKAGRGLYRAVLVVAVVGGATAVLLSTFTMAVFILGIEFAAVIAYWAIAGLANRRVSRVVCAVAIVWAGVIGLGAAAGTSQQLQFVIDKGQRLSSGVLEHGLATGDETNRGERLMNEVSVFVHRPFFGYVPGISDDFYVGGHSSLGDSLALYGVMFGWLWLGILWSIVRIAWKSSRTAEERFATITTWVMFILGGVLNPTWFSDAMLGAVVLFTVGPQQHEIPKALRSGSCQIESAKA